jgi:protein-tyrosine-phosphatase
MIESCPSAAETKRHGVLIVCPNNSARGPMAEAFLNPIAGDRFCAESAGLEPVDLDPLVIEVQSRSKNRSATPDERD